MAYLTDPWSGVRSYFNPEESRRRMLEAQRSGLPSGTGAIGSVVGTLTGGNRGGVGAGEELRALRSFVDANEDQAGALSDRVAGGITSTINQARGYGPAPAPGDTGRGRPAPPEGDPTRPAPAPAPSPGPAPGPAPAPGYGAPAPAPSRPPPATRGAAPFRRPYGTYDEQPRAAPAFQGIRDYFSGTARPAPAPGGTARPAPAPWDAPAPRTPAPAPPSAVRHEPDLGARDEALAQLGALGGQAGRTSLLERFTSGPYGENLARADALLMGTHGRPGLDRLRGQFGGTLAALRAPEPPPPVEPNPEAETPSSEADDSGHGALWSHYVRAMGEAQARAAAERARRDRARR